MPKNSTPAYIVAWWQPTKGEQQQVNEARCTRKTRRATDRSRYNKQGGNQTAQEARAGTANPTLRTTATLALQPTRPAQAPKAQRSLAGKTGDFNSTGTNQTLRGEKHA